MKPQGSSTPSRTTPRTARPKLPERDYAQKLVARNMRRIRIDKRLTQGQLAELSETSPVWISGCERGVRNLSLSSLSAIAFALGVDMRDLLDTAKHPMPPAGVKVYSRSKGDAA